MLPLTAGLIWLLTANLIAILPSQDHHWRAACALIATGLPLLIWIFEAHGALPTLPFLLGAASLLRWPLWHLWRRLRATIPR